MLLAENFIVCSYIDQAQVLCLYRDIAGLHRSGPGFGQSKRNAE